MTRAKKSVLIVDDSAPARKMLSEILESDPELRVVGTAPDPITAARKIQLLKPDVLTLNIEMQRMDGFTFLDRLMGERPLPVVVISSLTRRGAELTLNALERGAVEVIARPTQEISQALGEKAKQICGTVKAAASARIKRHSSVRRPPAPKFSADVPSAAGRLLGPPSQTDKVVVIGSSTGGVEALGVILSGLPRWCPGVAVVHHMPAKFTRVLAERLNRSYLMEVKEAATGDVLAPGRVLIAPGDRHMVLTRRGPSYVLNIRDGPLVNRQRPSVDVLFRSAVETAGDKAVGVVLTGMGYDGAEGLKELKEAGAYTIAQDEASCLVFGMPKEAIRLGAVEAVLPLQRIAAALLGLAKPGGPVSSRPGESQEGSEASQDG